MFILTIWGEIIYVSTFFIVEDMFNYFMDRVHDFLFVAICILTLVVRLMLKFFACNTLAQENLHVILNFFLFFFLFSFQNRLPKLKNLPSMVSLFTSQKQVASTNLWRNLKSMSPTKLMLDFIFSVPKSLKELMWV